MTQRFRSVEQKAWHRPHQLIHYCFWGSDCFPPRCSFLDTWLDCWPCMERVFCLWFRNEGVISPTWQHDMSKRKFSHPLLSRKSVSTIKRLLAALFATCTVTQTCVVRLSEQWHWIGLYTFARACGIRNSHLIIEGHEFLALSSSWGKLISNLLDNTWCYPCSDLYHHATQKGNAKKLLKSFVNFCPTLQRNHGSGILMISRFLISLLFRLFQSSLQCLQRVAWVLGDPGT